jgi:predicted nucleotidyltransferase
MKFFSETQIPEQPYPELQQILNTFVDEVAAELGENLLGIYLVGSLASGDFDLDSDVDFLVVTHTELTEADMKPLQDIQIKIHKIDSYPAKHLEGSYISIRDLNDWEFVGKKKLYYFDNGSTQYEESSHDNQWHVRWILRERGITLVGPDPKSILEPIPVDEMRNEIKRAMLQVERLFEDGIDRPLSFFNSRFGQSFIVLTYCRMLHSLHTGTVQSKKAGAEWAKNFVDSKWVDLIEQAWNERKGVRFMVKINQRAEQNLLHKTLEFVKFAVAKIDTIDVRTS